jgi:lysophospholipase L1-like esterase
MMLDKNVLIEQALVNKGNQEQIKRVMRKAQEGSSVSIGFIGGSITQGSLATTPKACYAYLVFEWWTKKFPNSKFKYINAGIGATSSHFGVARIQEDLLMYHPDFIIVDFSVNDENNAFFEETYEGLIRKILGYDKNIGILILNHVRYDNGENAQEIHNRIGEYYNLPCVSMKDSFYPLIEKVKIDAKKITPDNLHPNNLGHKIIAQIITGILNKIDQNKDVKESVMDIPTALTKNNYENSARYQNNNCQFTTEGFIVDDAPKDNIRDIFKKGWIGTKLGDSIHFMIEGSEIAVQYRKTIHKPTPIATIILDDEETGIMLDGNFEETWGDCLFIQPITIEKEQQIHKLQIKIIESHKEDQLPFYLASMITSF